MAVSALVLEAGGDEDLAIAALLHDVVEDQGGPPTLQTIRRMFGDRVANVVMECSDTDREPKPPWRERKERYLAHQARLIRNLVHPGVWARERPGTTKPDRYMYVAVYEIFDVANSWLVHRVEKSLRRAMERDKRGKKA